MRKFAWNALIIGGISFFLGGCSFFSSPPRADFSWTPLTPLERNDVHFLDRSQPGSGLFGSAKIVAWNWDFGDGTTSSAQNPVHRYSCEGDYEVVLVVRDSNGLEGRISYSVHVDPSINGLWQGTLWDAWGRTFDLRFELHQSAPGSVTGTAYVNGLSCPLIEATLDPSSKQVRFSFTYWGTGNTWLLTGTYDNCNHMSGWWQNVTWGTGKIGDWEVHLVGVSPSEEEKKSRENETLR